MNVPEDHYDEIEHLNTHPDLLPPADDEKKLLERDSVVLIKALTPRVLPCTSKAIVKAISTRVAPCGTVAPTQAIRPRKAIYLGIVTRRPLQASKKATNTKVVPSKALLTREKTVTSTATETFPRRKTTAKAIV